MNNLPLTFSNSSGNPVVLIGTNELLGTSIASYIFLPQKMKGGDIFMFGFISSTNKSAESTVNWAKRQLLFESNNLRNGFGKMDKARSTGKVQVLSDLLEFLGVDQKGINKIVTEGTELAESNLISWHN